MTTPGPAAFSVVTHFAEVGSTNSFLLDAAASGLPEGAVVVADHQSAGRGRLDRRWESPPGSGLLASILFRPRLDPAELFTVTALLALAACEAVEACAGVALGAKWPNDLVSGDLKVAGILAESRGNGTDQPVVVAGIGVNVHWPAPGPEATELRATCLDTLAGRALEVGGLLDALLGALEARHPSLLSPTGRGELIAELARRTVTIGRRVRVELAGETCEGTALAIDERGRLVVDVAGRQRTVSAGDVVHLR